MIQDLSKYSKEFQFFYEAFAFETYGKSMGRAAEHAVADFSKLSAEEQKIGIDWFLYLFSQNKEYYGIPYIWVIRYSKDPRFIPLLKAYYKRLKARNHKRATTYIENRPFTMMSNFDTELKLCKATIKELKRAR